jgi:hypothetical protein
LEIWKAVLRELQSHKSTIGLENKKISMHYKFGSSRKKKRKNYMMQIGDELIKDI